MSGGKQLPIDRAILIPKIASLLALGRSTTQIAEQLNCGFNTVRTLSGKQECKDLVKEISDAVLSTAKAVGRRQVAELTEVAVEALKDLLKQKNVAAVQTVFKIIGIMGQEEQSGARAAQSLTVILPGATAEKPSIEVPSESEELGMGRSDSGSGDS